MHKRYAEVVQVTWAKVATFFGFARTPRRIETRQTQDYETQDWQIVADSSARGSALTPIDMDDDAVAEVIRRALPALERARATGDGK
jgi:hypothetical protein